MMQAYLTALFISIFWGNPNNNTEREEPETETLEPQVELLKEKLKRLVWEDRFSMLEQTKLDDQRLNWIKNNLKEPHSNGAGLSMKLRKWHQYDQRYAWATGHARNRELINEVIELASKK